MVAHVRPARLPPAADEPPRPGRAGGAGRRALPTELSGACATFADLLTRHRQRRGLSMAQLARSASIHHSYISRVEHGGPFPSRHIVLLLARALGLDPFERDRLLLAADYRPETLVDWTPLLARIAAVNPRTEPHGGERRRYELVLGVVRDYADRLRADLSYAEREMADLEHVLGLVAQLREGAG